MFNTYCGFCHKQPCECPPITTSGGTVSNKKEWRVFNKVEFIKYKQEGSRTTTTEFYGTHVRDLIQIEAYEAEKQRADVLKNYNEANSGLAKARKKAIYDLEKENQKLRAALEKIIEVSGTSTEHYHIAKEALK